MVWREDTGRLGVGTADKTMILGTGLAELNAAYYLNVDYRIYEKESNVRGLCRSRCMNGFVSDHAAHTISAGMNIQQH